MKVKVVGYREVDMVSEDGKPIQGVSLYITYPNDGVVGAQASKQFVNRVMQHSCGYVPKVDQYVNLEYGPNGRVVSVAALEE